MIYSWKRIQALLQTKTQPTEDDRLQRLVLVSHLEELQRNSQVLYVTSHPNGLILLLMGAFAGGGGLALLLGVWSFLR